MEIYHDGWLEERMRFMNLCYIDRVNRAIIKAMYRLPPFEDLGEFFAGATF